MANDMVFANGTRQGIAALLFLQAATMTLDAFSAFQSSPWTIENVGADDKKAASAKEYVWHAIGNTFAWGGGASLIAHSWWPIIGVIIADTYMYWLYMRALARARGAGSRDWPGGMSYDQSKTAA